MNLPRIQALAAPLSAPIPSVMFYSSTVILTILSAIIITIGLPDSVIYVVFFGVLLLQGFMIVASMVKSISYLGDRVRILEYKPKSKPGFIYLIKREEDGIYKIGKTINPSARIGTHIRDYESDFSIVAMFAVPNTSTFEQVALGMTSHLFYREQKRRELRQMSKSDVDTFMSEFQSFIMDNQ